MNSDYARNIREISEIRGEKNNSWWNSWLIYDNYCMEVIINKFDFLSYYDSQ